MTGLELVKEINQGKYRKLAPRQVDEVRSSVSDACEELIETGARVRPLLVGDVQLGWVRGVHAEERRCIGRWFVRPVDRLGELLRVGTSLSPGEIAALTTVEVNSLARVIQRMTESDDLLYGYLSAFSTTSVSERLWCSTGRAGVALDPRPIRLPGGRSMELLATPGHTRLWAFLCSNRDRNRQYLADSLNSLSIIRAWVGKGADAAVAEVREAQRRFITDQPEPWMEVIPEKRNPDIDDGWGHAEDDSPDGMLRQVQAMLSGDRHEKVMEAWAEQQKQQMDREDEELRSKVTKAARGVQVTSGPPVTKEEMLRRLEELRGGAQPGMSMTQEERTDSARNAYEKYK